jgi:hypothetical protein
MEAPAQVLVNGRVRAVSRMTDRFWLQIRKIIVVLPQMLSLPPGWIKCPPYGRPPMIAPGKILNVIPSKARSCADAPSMIKTKAEPPKTTAVALTFPAAVHMSRQHRHCFMQPCIPYCQPLPKPVSGAFVIRLRTPDPGRSSLHPEECSC